MVYKEGGIPYSLQKSVHTPKILFLALRVLAVMAEPAISSAVLSSARKIARCSGEEAAKDEVADRPVRGGGEIVHR